MTEEEALATVPDLPPIVEKSLHWHPDGQTRPLEDQDRELFEKLLADAADVLA
jgi:hypothetical protein